MPSTAMSPEQFREAVLERFERTPLRLAREELEAILDKGLFNDFVGLSEMMEQFRLIADELVKNCTDYDRDLLAQLKDNTFVTYRFFQKIILELPQAVIATNPDAPAD
jgi:hypothetical protein